MFKEPLFYLIMSPKHKSNDAGISDSQREAIKCFLKVKMYVYIGQNIVHMAQDYLGFQSSTGGLGTSLLWIRGY